VVRNPVITPDLETLAQATVESPWFGPDTVPVILGAGGLRTQKDFPTLMRAFARVRGQRRCRLVILGRGRLLGRLQTLARELGVQEDTAFPGFVENPYPLLRRASVFVLSSRWEGSPNVLTEALALGTPVVSADCLSGPREILDGGRYGPLVPVGDAAAMAAAILQVLDAPLPAALLRQAAEAYTVEENARRYKLLLDTVVGD
jgi:glycosyltransferase involved in cell wall biosynthesis